VVLPLPEAPEQELLGERVAVGRIERKMFLREFLGNGVFTEVASHAEENPGPESVFQAKIIPPGGV
jgi:hypothetical protein